MSVDQTLLGLLLVDLLNPHCVLIHVAQALFKLYRLGLINHCSILVCAKKVRNHIINSLTSDWTMFLFVQRWHSNSSSHSEQKQVRHSNSRHVVPFHCYAQFIVRFPLQATQWALRNMVAERGPMDNRTVMADQTTVLGRIPAGVHVAAAETELEASTLLVKERLRHAQAHA
jgi:hypothetical protein